jgi:subtilisin
MDFNAMNVKILLLSIPMILCLLVNYTGQAIGQSIINEVGNTGIGSEEAEILPQLLVKFSESDKVIPPSDVGTDVEPTAMSLDTEENLEVFAANIVETINDKIMQSNEPINETTAMSDIGPQFKVKTTYKNFDTAVLELQSAIEEEPGPLGIAELVSATEEEVKVINETINQAINITGLDSIQPVRIFEASAQTIPEHIKRIGADSGVLKVGDGTNNVDSNIAILDTGISNHPDLNIVHSKSFLSNDVKDNCGHGTHVAGIAGAKDNEIGIVGAAPGANLWNLKVLEKKPNGKCTGSETAIIDALNYTIGKDIDVLNLSLGAKCSATSTLCGAPVYESIINDVINDGKVVIAAAGNKGEDARNFLPATFDGVITVSAISDSDGLCGGLGSETSWDSDDAFASFSNYGTVIDIAAPGVDILSTFLNNDYAKLSGTSMASPLVAGIFASYKSLHPELGVSALKNAILNAGNTIQTVCSENRGYINGGTMDPFPEPLLYVKNIK